MTTLELDTNGVFHRKMNGLHQDEPLNHTEQVDIQEKIYNEDDSRIVRKTRKIRWTVKHFDELPEWLQDNEFLHRYHRPPIPSLSECFRSIWSIHSETGNIWTHLLGCVGFLLLALWFLNRPETHFKFQEKLIFSFFFAGAILCLGLSFTFHTVSCHSHGIKIVFRKLDYTGISLLIVGSFIPWIYYGFYCRMAPKVIYIAMISLFGLSATVVSLSGRFNDARFRPLRAAIFSAMGLSGVIPAVHLMFTDGLQKLIDVHGFYWLLAMAFLYLFGAFLYAARIPERIFPGRCDIIFQSHQLFHICVVCAALSHYYGISILAMNKLSEPCH